MIAIASILSKIPNLQINLRGRPFFLGFFFFFFSHDKRANRALLFLFFLDPNIIPVR